MPHPAPSAPSAPSPEVEPPPSPMPTAPSETAPPETELPRQTPQREPPVRRAWTGSDAARVALPLLLVLALGTYVRWSPPAPVPDDTWGGIRSSDLTARCREQVSARTYGQEPDLSFPPPREAAAQLSTDADGKRWTGWAQRPDGSHLDFVCSYSAATGDLSLELMP